MDIPVTENGVMKDTNVAIHKSPNITLNLGFRRNTASALTMNNKTFMGTAKEPSQAMACAAATHPDSLREVASAKSQK